MKKNQDPLWSCFGLSEEVPEERLVGSTSREWYEAKHPRPSPDEIALVNSAVPEACPFCGCGRIAKNGRRPDGVQKYSCRGCGRSFNPLTGTLFDSRKIPLSEWVEFLLHLFEFHSVKTSARDNRNAESTGKYWLAKVFSALEGCQDGVVLAGRVWLDETFVKVDARDRQSKGGRGLRGISRNLIAIGTATDGKGLLVAAEWRSKPAKRSTLELFGKHITPGSTLVHDGDNSHRGLIESLGLESEVHPTSETKGLGDNENPMDPINDVHDKLKRFLRSHGGYARRDLQGWLNLFWFIWSEPRNRYEKAARLIKMAISANKIIRYRDLYGKKD